MKHPDGEITFFNDAATGIAFRPAVLERYFSELEGEVPEITIPSVSYLSTSGYVRMTGDSSVLFVDVVDIGPAYLPGHGHATRCRLSFHYFHTAYL